METTLIVISAHRAIPEHKFTEIATGIKYGFGGLSLDKSDNSFHGELYIEETKEKTTYRLFNNGNIGYISLGDFVYTLDKIETIPFSERDIRGQNIRFTIKNAEGERTFTLYP